MVSTEAPIQICSKNLLREAQLIDRLQLLLLAPPVFTLSHTLPRLLPINDGPCWGYLLRNSLLTWPRQSEAQDQASFLSFLPHSGSDGMLSLYPPVGVFFILYMHSH